MVELYGEPPRRAALFVNRESRRGEVWFDTARDHLTKQGLEIVDARSFRFIHDLQTAVAEHVEAELPMVVVGGGDGTLSAVARFFAHRETVFGVLPMGTGNAFARDLGIPPDLNHACELLHTGKVASVDMGALGDRRFLNVATIGLSTLIAAGIRSPLKKILGRTLYVFSVARALGKVQPFLVKLESEGTAESFECLQLVIGNGRFHAGPFPISPDATITGGFLAIYALATRDRGAFVRMATHMYNGHHVDLCEVKYFRSKSGRIDSVPSQQFTLDGEISLRTPQSFGISERALKVVVSQQFHE